MPKKTSLGRHKTGNILVAILVENEWEKIGKEDRRRINNRKR